MKLWTVVLAGVMGLCAGAWAADEKPVQVKLGGRTWESAFQTDDLRIEQGLMKATCLGFDPYLESKKININTGSAKAITVKMAITGGSDGMFFWATQEGRRTSPYSPQQSMAFTLIPDGRMHTYIVPVGRNETWKGTVADLRFDPCSEPMARFAIAAIEPGGQPAPVASLWYLGSDEITLTEGATLPVEIAAVNTGGVDLKDVEVSAKADGAVSVEAEKAGSKLDLPAGEKSAAAKFTVKAGQATEAAGKLTLAVAAEKGERKEIPVHVVKPLAGIAGRVDPLVDFESADGNSQWIVTGAKVTACKDGEDGGVAFSVNGQAKMSFGWPISSANGFVLKAAGTGGMTAVIRYEDAAGKRYAVGARVGEKPETVMIPAGFAGGMLQSMEVYGSGTFQVYGLSTFGGAGEPATVLLHGPGFFRNEEPSAPGYIAEIRRPFVAEVKGNPEAEATVELAPVELGEVGPIAGTPAPSKITASGKGKVQVLIPDKMGIGAYDLTISSPALTKPYKTRLYAVEAQSELEKMRKPVSEAIYGPPQAKGSDQIAPFAYGVDARAMENQGVMSLYETDLSPAWLLKIGTPKASVFQGLSSYGLGQPTYLAVPTAQGVKVVKAEGTIKPEMSEPWLLAWFAGAKGWTVWDVPQLVVLQHKPTSIVCGADKMELTFGQPCGYLAYLPLYGFYRPPQKGQEVLSKQGLPERGIQTWTWADGLPKEVEAKARWWGQVLRKYPIDCEEKFNVDPGNGSVTVSQKFSYITIEDDWKTQPITAAPVSPTLGFTQLAKGFPIRFSKPVYDPDCMTPYGPYMVVTDADSYTYTVDKVVDYVNETEIQDQPKADDPAVAKALGLGQEMLRRRFAGGPRYMVEFDRKLFVWAQLAEHCFPKGEAYADPDTQAYLKGAYANYYNTFFFGTAAHPADGERGWWRPDLKDMPPKAREWYQQNTICIDGPGIHGGLFGDSGKISASAVYNIWNYVHYCGDWDLAKRRWSFIRSGNTNAVNMDWKAMGRNSNAEAGEHMPPTMAFARLAYLAGDMDAYYYGCYSFMRECLMVFAKQRAAGGEYFRLRQPYADTTPMPYWALPTHTLGEAAGWMLDTQVDGAKYEPVHPGEVQAQNRWVRFSSEDCGRFYRENLRDQEEEELDALVKNHLQLHSKPVSETASFAASQLRLMSYLLDAPTDRLVKTFPMETWKWETSENGTLMMSLAVVRSSYPRQYNRLIPKETPASGFVTGLARQPVTSGWRGLVLFRVLPGRGPDWPMSRWYGRGKNVLPVKNDHFWMGRITPGVDKTPASIETQQINWVTKVTAFKAN